MQTKTLCQAILDEACDASVDFYRNMVESQSIEQVTDPLWREYLLAMRSLPSAQREVLLRFNRQVTVDAISTVLGGIDGSLPLAGNFIALSLTDNDGTEHAGGLLEKFRALAER